MNASILYYIVLLLFSQACWSASDQVTPLWNQRMGYQARIDSALDSTNRRLDVLTFTLKEDDVGLHLLAVAIEVVKNGGVARIGYDGYSSKVSPELVQYMTTKGVQMREFRPMEIDWEKLLEYGLIDYFYYLNIRNHQKLFLTDLSAIVGSSNYTRDISKCCGRRDHEAAAS